MKKNLRPAAKKASKHAASPADRKLSKMLCSMLVHLPAVSATQHMGHTSFVAGKNVFAFTRNDGVALKLPRERAQSMVQTGDAQFLIMGKRTMKEWVVIHRPTLEAYSRDKDILIESKDYVASLRRAKKKLTLA